MVAAIKKRDLCCLYAVIAVVAVISLISFFRGYGFSDWAATTWLGVLAIIAAVLVCMKCGPKDEDQE